MEKLNNEQEEIVRKGVEHWNNWRRLNPGELVRLRRARFMTLDLRNADFCGVDLSYADLTGSDLTGANLSGAKLQSVEAGAATFDHADLTNANLISGNFRGASFVKANVVNARLEEANLVRADFSGADLTGSYLYGAAKEDWVIKQVSCDYIIIDADGRQQTPSNRKFLPEEFEQLYTQLPTIEYIFENGIDLLDMAILDNIVNEINELHSDWNLKIESFQARATPKAVFTIVDENLIRHAFEVIKNKYEIALSRLEGSRSESRNSIEKMIHALLNAPKGDVVNHGNVINNFGQTESLLTTNQVAHVENKVLCFSDDELPQIKAQLQILQDALKNELNQSDNTNIKQNSVELEAISQAINAAETGDKGRLIEHLKKAGKKSLEVAEKVGVSVLSSVIKQTFGL